MISYRCYLLGDDGKIKNVEVLDSPTDAVALEEAKQRFVNGKYPAIEVWDRARRVGIVGQSNDPTAVATQEPTVSVRHLGSQAVA